MFVLQYAAELIILEKIGKIFSLVLCFGDISFISNGVLIYIISVYYIFTL